MKALIDSNGDLLVIAEDLSGYETKGRSVIDNVPEDPHNYIWNRERRTFEPRPPSEREKVVAAARSDELLEQLGKATAEQMETMVSDVKDINDVKRVLRSILLAIRALQIASSR